MEPASIDDLGERGVDHYFFDVGEELVAPVVFAPSDSDGPSFRAGIDSDGL